MMKKLRYTFIFTIGFFSLALAQDTIPNPSFERWVDQGNPTGPEGWLINSNISMANTVYQTGAGHTGSVALLESQNGVVAFIMAGSGTDTGFAYVVRPAYLNFYCKYDNAGIGDSAIVMVQLTKWDMGQRQIIGEGVFYITTSGGFNGMDYKAGDVTINYMQQGNPDTARIFIAANTSTDIDLSQLFIDDLAFSDMPAGISNITKNQYKIETYPNPAMDRVNFNAATEAKMIKIIDASGKLLATVPVTAKKAIYVTSSLANGLYQFEAVDKNNQTIGTGKFSVLH